MFLSVLTLAAIMGADVPVDLELANRMAVGLEIVDQRELDYGTELIELRVLRKRWKDLSGVPSLTEINRLYGMSRDSIMDLKTENVKVKQWIVGLKECYPQYAGEYDNAISECDEMWATWDMLYDAKCEYYYIYFRRDRAKQLIERIGVKNFYSQRMPPHLPFWRLREID